MEFPVGAARSLLQDTSLSVDNAGGVGAGVFVLIFFSAVGIGLCMVGSHTEKAGVMCLVATTLMVIVATVLFVAPRRSQQAQLHHEIKGYDQTVIYRGLLLVIMALGVLAALVGLVVYHAQPPVYARPISLREDVLRYR